MGVYDNAAQVLELFRPGTVPQWAQLALEAATDGGYWVVLRQRTGEQGWLSARKGVSPLPLEAACALRDRLVGAKLDDGFLGAGAVVPPVALEGLGLSRAQLARLAQRIAPDDWRVLSVAQRARTVWRLGELRVAMAVPRMVELLGTGDAMLDYCLAWAIGRCGDPGALQAMAELSRRSSAAFVKRIARVACLQLQSAPERLAHAEKVVADWPAPLREAWQSGDDVYVGEVLRDPQTWDRASYADWLEQLDEVALSDPRARRLLLGEAAKAPLKAGTFRCLRHLYKYAEFRGDAALWALLQHRFERTGHAFRRTGQKDQRVYQNGETLRVSAELSHPFSRLAYSDRTRAYLVRRGWRSLRRLGNGGSAEFGPLAFAALMRYDDADVPAEQVVNRYFWQDRRWHQAKEYRHRHCHASLFNRLLFAPGGPVRGNRHGLCWRSDQPLGVKRAARFEPFVALWNQRPDLLLQLALAARAEQVQSFAVRALADAPAYCAGFDDAIWRRLLNSPFSPTAEFALAQLQARIEAAPDREQRESWLALLLGSRHSGVWRVALTMLESDPASHAGSPALVLAVLTARSNDVRRQSRLLCQAAQGMRGVAAAVLPRVLDWLDDADGLTEAVGEIADNLAWIVANPFRFVAEGVDYARLLRLLQHPVVALRCLAVDWLMIHQQPVSALPLAVWRPLLDSEDERLLGAGMRLLGVLPEEVLKTQAELVARFCLCPVASARQAVRPLALRLAAADKGFLATLIERLLDALFRAEAVAGLHDEVFSLLTDPLSEASRALPIETVLRLLEARSRAAQRFGAWLLAAWPDEVVALASWVKLARHDDVVIRERALTILDAQFSALGIEGLLPVLDSRWADSRERAMTWLKTRVALADWSMSQLIALCDHAHGDVQNLGCTLMGQRLTGGERDVASLIALAQHPSQKVQGFVADFLSHSAVDDAAALSRLRPYFLTVLAQVNRGRAAKTAVLAFLRTQVTRSEAAAREVASLFEHLAVTVAITDRAQFIAGLYDIRCRYPAIGSGLVVHAPVVREGA